MERLSGDFSIGEFLTRGNHDVLYRPKVGKLSDPDVNRILLGKVLTLFAEMELTVFEALLFLEAAERNLLLVNRVSVPEQNEVGMYRFPLD